MSILAVGSIGLDSVKTPFGEVKDVLGGSGTYFSVSASYFTKVNLVAVVGNDFPKKYVSLLEKKKINLKGLQRVKGKTFRWKGHYMNDINTAETLDTQLNVFADFNPEIPASYCHSEYVFLGNIDPALQRAVLSQVKKPKLVACDTMNFWITGKRDELLKTLKKIDILLINEGEARLLAKEKNLVKAAKIIMKMGPSALVIKRGEYGAMYIDNKNMFAVPGMPLEKVCDPTGAGDSFGGGFMGYLAKAKAMTPQNIRRAMVYGSVMASHNVQNFSLTRLSALKKTDINARYAAFKKLTKFA